MKKYILIAAMLLSAPAYLSAQKAPYNVVFDITSKDTTDHKLLIRWMHEILTADANAKIEAVFYSQGLSMLIKDKTNYAQQIQELSSNKNISFRACAVAMKNQNVDKSQLVSGAETVPDGIYEIISKQHDGWGYIKVSH